MIGGPYVWMAAAIAFLVSVGGALWKGYGLGESATRAEYAARDIQEAREAQIAYAGIVNRYRSQEAAWANKVTSISTRYQKDLTANEKALDVAISGSRLYDRTAINPKACDNGTAKVAGNTGVGNGGSGTYISEAAGIFLRRLANEADAVTIQLSACQDILASERLQQVFP